MHPTVQSLVRSVLVFGLMGIHIADFPAWGGVAIFLLTARLVSLVAHYFQKVEPTSAF